ncbi:anti-sigma factor family protein [Quisquiliibacterium transsilvanicum]|uniref:Anti-sigma factor RsiW n=1 Tax=Quisquiliibacterium transsilvanicum TaxID=1549638 RepID=A0A7W8HI53_9BURK|nr:anti-sigma factor [Quisquiliibacterium transsilvanicum]MBB5272491.1 anti-sigma factor RsiW [Quisquiliibacterium transsilvanicum]
MSTSNPPITDAELHAWVDDQLAPIDRERVAAALARDPSLRELAEHYLGQNEDLRRRFSCATDEPAPGRLLQAAMAPAGSRLGRLAGLAAALLLGVGAGWFAHGNFSQPSGPNGESMASGAGAVALPLPRAAVVAHAAYAPEVRHPVEVRADDEAHLVAWLSKRLGTRLSIPDLRQHGFSLVGGRLLPDAIGSVAAQFMFESGTGQRLTLFVRRDSSGADTAFRFAKTDGLTSFFWIDRGFGYALSAEMPRETMLELAGAVHAQTSP